MKNSEANRKIDEAISLFRNNKELYKEKELEAENLLSRIIEDSSVESQIRIRAYRLRYAVRWQLKDVKGALSDSKRANRIERALDYFKNRRSFKFIFNNI